MGPFEKVAVADLKFRAVALSFVLAWAVTTGIGTLLVGESSIEASAVVGLVVAAILAYAVADRLDVVPSEYPGEMPGRRGGE